MKWMKHNKIYKDYFKLIIGNVSLLSPISYWKYVIIKILKYIFKLFVFSQNSIIKMLPPYSIYLNTLQLYLYHNNYLIFFYH